MLRLLSPTQFLQRRFWKHVSFEHFHHWGGKQPSYIKVGAILLVLGLGVRATPYLIPIRAEALEQEDRAVEFRDRHNRPLGRLLSRDQEHTAVVPLDQVSPHFIQAILAAEDQDFYQHGPVDWKAAARASWQGLRDRRIVSGASTVTMQLARMVDPVPRTFPGKAQQVWQAWRLGAGMDKDEILAAYVNRLPMGGNIYGVEAAARAYFGIPAGDLTVAQASLLAALPNAPTALNPYTGWEALKERQRYVLDRMVVTGELSEEQSDRAFAETVNFQLPEQQVLAAPHFQFWLAQNLPDNYPSQIQTTLDLNLQRFVEAQVQQMVKGLAKKQVRHGAALVVDNATGEVLAYVGSPSYFGASLGMTPLNDRAGGNDGVQALRQPGSTLKPFLYQLALEQGIIQPHSILQDVPTHYAIPGAQLYSPVDFNEAFQGPVRVRAALGNSLNIPAVRVLEEVGVEDFLVRLQQLGLESLSQSAEHYGLGLALGSGEVSLWELTQAYLTLANGGDRNVQLTATRQGRSLNQASDAADSNGPLLNRPVKADAQPLQILGEGRNSHSSRFASGSPSLEIGGKGLGDGGQPEPKHNTDAQATWSLITDMLSDPHARATAFGVESVLNLPFPAAVKTGTSSDFRDTWTVGFTQDYTVATWVGNFDGSPMHQVSGVTGAAPLWHRIMVRLHEGQEPGQFAPPKGMVKRPICATTGLKPGKDCEAVVQEYFFGADLAAYELSVGALAKVAAVEARGLRIVSPGEGDRFVLFPDSTSGNEQRLQFAVADGAADEPVEWWLNGERLTGGEQGELFWPMQAGQWRLEARLGEQATEIQFSVEEAEVQENRKGFSVRQVSQP